MGHTIPPMRWIIYGRISHLRKLAKALREPEKSIADSLIYNINQHISAITYANPLPDEIENDMIFAMLIHEKLKNPDNDIENLTLACFALMVKYKMKRLNDERDTNRLLQAKREDNTLD